MSAPPHNLEAEQALLGALMFDNAAFERLPDQLRAEHFYEPFHGRLFAEVAALVGKGLAAEPVVLQDRFRQDPAFGELGGLRYLADLVDRAPMPVLVPDHARSVVGNALRREIMRIGAGLVAAAESGKDEHGLDIEPRALIERAEGLLYAAATVGEPGRGTVSFSTALDGVLETAERAFAMDGSLVGLSTGLTDLDQRLGGLHPSDLLILAGRPSMGKTALATNIAFDIARKYRGEVQPDGARKAVAGGVVQIFSLEMSAEQLAQRILSERAGVPSNRIRTGQINEVEFARLRDAADEIRSAPLFIDDTGGLSIERLAARARRQKRKTGLDLIVVDYLQLVTCASRRGEGRVQEVSQITQALKALAKELNVPVMALSQLSRQVEQREDKRPQLSDLRESGSIEQDADAVMFVYREAYYVGRAEPKDGTQEHLEWEARMDELRHLAEVIIGKQRHGPIGTVRLAFNEDTTRFGNLEREPRRERRPLGPAPATPRYLHEMEAAE